MGCRKISRAIDRRVHFIIPGSTFGPYVRSAPSSEKSSPLEIRNGDLVLKERLDIRSRHHKNSLCPLMHTLCSRTGKLQGCDTDHSSYRDLPSMWLQASLICVARHIQRLCLWAMIVQLALKRGAYTRCPRFVSVSPLGSTSLLKFEVWAWQGHGRRRQEMCNENCKATAFLAAASKGRNEND